MKLTEKQKRFADYYIESGNATQSAIKAGYSKKTAKETGYENLTKPHISMYIEKRITEADSKRIATAKEVLELLTSFARDEEANARDRIKAAELLGKRHALFTEKHEVEANVNHNPYSELTTEELRKIIDK